MNQNCENPPPIGSCRAQAIVDLDGFGRYEGTTLGSPNTHDGTCGISVDAPEVVHRFQVGEAGEVCVHTEGSQFDTISYVRFDCGQRFSEGGCNQDSPLGGLQSQYSFFGAPGTDFYIFVDGHDAGANDRGDYTLTVLPGPCPQCRVSAHCPAGLLCQGGFCGAPPLPGDVIINEVITGPAEVAALEFKNVSDVTTNLSGCVLEIDHDAIEIDELPLDAGQWNVLPQGILAGGIEPNAQIALRCAENLIDALDLSIQGFPEITGHLALSRDLGTAAFNDDPLAWCTQGPSLNADNQQCDRCTLSPCEAPSGISCMGDTLRRSEVTCSIQSGQIENTCTVENVDRACAPGVCLENQCAHTR